MEIRFRNSSEGLFQKRVRIRRAANEMRRFSTPDEFGHVGVALIGHDRAAGRPVARKSRERKGEDAQRIQSSASLLI